MYCDNELAVNNYKMPEFTLKKQNISICCQIVIDSCAECYISISREPSDTNLSGVMMNIILSKSNKVFTQKVL